MSFIKAALFSFAMAPAAVWSSALTANELEKYIYIIYYDSTECGLNAVSFHGQVANEEFKVQGGYPYANASVSEPRYSECGFQTSCMINPASQQCLELNQTISGVVEFEINEHGRIVECDETNVESGSGIAECSIREGCTVSSVYPGCRASDLYIRPTLLREPSFLENNEGVGLGDWTSYMLFYSDDQCSNFEGTQGIMTGVDEIVVADVNCDDAMACLYAPNGEKCQAIDESLKVVKTYYTKNDDFKTYNCTSATGENCVEREDACSPSPIPQCYYRWVSARTLFSDPASYVKAVPSDLDTSSVSTQCDGDCPSSLGVALNPVAAFAVSATAAFVNHYL